MVASNNARRRTVAPVCAALLAAALAFVGCASGPDKRPNPWPDVETAPASAPSDLETDSPSPVLRRASDGFLYAVGSLPDSVEPGTPFIAQFAGDWPIDRVGRPPLAAGRVVQRTGDESVLVHLSYQMPDVDIEGLEVKWQDSVFTAPVGKGLHKVADVSRGARPAATFQTGKNQGIESGDVFALLAPKSEIDGPRDAQLTRRLTRVCRVTKVEEKQARCRYRPPQFAADRQVSSDHVAVFLEHTLAEGPQTGVVEVAAVKGGDDGLTERLRDVFEKSIGRRAGAEVEIEATDEKFDATRADFHRVESQVDYEGRPKMLASASVVERNDEEHLVVNYTGVGPVAGPGMVAAPPIGGVDLGPVSSVNPQALTLFATTVYTGLLVYRGQTTQALGLLRNLLKRPNFVGPLRWHVRDQYAMRWGALGYYQEALWLVLEDHRLAERRENRRARLNAAGTLVNLYDFLGQSDRAVEASREYLEARSDAKPGAPWLSALGMHAELLAGRGELEPVHEAVDKLEKHCLESCQTDLFTYLGGIWWSLPNDGAEELENEILDRLIELGKKGGDRELAAARLKQGMMELRDEDPDEGLIAFLEAARLYKRAKDRVGQSRAKHFAMVAHVRREDYQSAYETGKTAADLRKQIRDVEGLTRTYQRLGSLYSNLDFEKVGGQYLRSARSVLRTGYEYNRARGDFGAASESLFTLASFLMKLRQTRTARSLFEQAVGFAVSATKFEIAAMSHLYLAVISRRNDDSSGFREEISRAKNMAKLADSPKIDKAIERVLNPKEDSKPEDVPSQLL